MPRANNNRDKIVQAGLKLMYEQGFNGCSVQDITEDADVPKGSFYTHFPSKEDLALEVLQQYQPKGDPAILARTSGTSGERIQDYFEAAAAEFGAGDARHGCLLGNFSAELSDLSERIRTALSARYDAWQAVLAQAIRGGVESGELPADVDPDQIGRYLISSWEGAILQMKVERSDWPVRDFLELLPFTLRIP